MTPKFVIASVAAVLMGLGHLAQTRWGVYYTAHGWREEFGLCLTIIGVSTFYSLISNTRKTSVCLALTATSGFLYYLISLHWIGESLTVDHSVYTWLSVWGSIGITAIFFPWWLVAVLAYKLINIYVVRSADSNRLNPVIFAACWSLADLGLSDIAYGIPLGILGTALVGTVFEPIYAAFGLHGATFLLVWSAAEISRAVQGNWFSLPASAALGCIFAGVFLGAHPVGQAATPTIKVATVQTNSRVPVGMAAEDFNQQSIETNLHAIRTAFSHGAEVVLLPESAFLDDLADNQDLAERVATAIPRGRFLVTGAREYQISGDIETGLDVKTFNVVHVMDHTGIFWTYRKSHLVLFGEYMPWIFRILGYDVLGGPPGGLAEGTGLRPLTIGDLPPALITICFEGLLSGPVQRSLDDATWMMNLSNEALFGTTAGPQLINQYHRIRSMELGVPTVRSVATSFTGVIDATGRQVSISRPEAYGVIVEEITTGSRKTVFRTLGHYPLYLMLGAVFLIATVRRKRQFRRIF